MLRQALVLILLSISAWAQGARHFTFHYGFIVKDVPAGQKVRVCMLPVGDSRFELLEPMSPESPISKFLDKRGGGLHHVAVSVEDIQTALRDLKAKGTRLIDEEPRAGAGGCLVAFIHPSSTGGVLLELVQDPQS